MNADLDADWEAATDLSFAYWAFAEPHQRTEYRNKTNKGASQALIELMLVNLFSALRSGELRAIGFRVEPDISACPVEVPRYYFDQRPNVDDSLNDRLISSGVQYDRVRVAKNTNQTPIVSSKESIALQPLATVDPTSLESEALEIVAEPDPLASRVVDQKRGRPRLDEPIICALWELFEIDPALIRKSAARLMPEFLQIFPKHSEKSGFDVTTISERTLRENLKRFRKELEKTSQINWK